MVEDSRRVSVLKRIVLGTMERTAWGLNLSKVSCPRCEARQPLMRRPTSRRQRDWGGWTCRGCGCEMDKWGRAIAD